MSRPYKVVNANILPYTNLWPLKLADANAISARYRNAKAYTITAFQVQTPMHPLRLQAQKRWETRTEPLWWSTITHKNLRSQRTVRSWASRRVRQAFVEALRKKGFAPDGTPIKGTGGQAPLYGTLQLAADPGALKASSEQLLKEADKVVLEIIRRQEGGPYNDTGKIARNWAKKRKHGQPSEQQAPGFNVRKKKI